MRGEHASGTFSAVTMIYDQFSVDKAGLQTVLILKW